MNPSLFSLAAAVAVLSLPLSAQRPKHLVGLTDTTPLVVSQNLDDCRISQCAPALFPATRGIGGGTAYDATTSGVWISNGVRIAKVDVRNRCRYQCPPATLPNISANALVTGLAFDEPTRTLWATFSNNVIHQYEARGCTLTLRSRCIPALPNNFAIGGIATDDARRLVFFAASPNPPTSAITGGVVWVSRMSDPCNPICRLSVPRCSNGALRFLSGVAFDACERALWVTDGSRTVGLRVDLAACAAREFQCCRLPILTDRYVGLALAPTAASRHGDPCTAGDGCASCPNLTHTLTGDPTLSNLHFFANVENAPARSFGFLVFNGGACVDPGVRIPPWCAPIRVRLRPAPVVIGPLSTGGSALGRCDGRIRFRIAVPADLALCGDVFSSQFIGLCGTNDGRRGSWVTECLTYRVTL